MSCQSRETGATDKRSNRDSHNRHEVPPPQHTIRTEILEDNSNSHKAENFCASYGARMGQVIFNGRYVRQGID